MTLYMAVVDTINPTEIKTDRNYIKNRAVNTLYVYYKTGHLMWHSVFNILSDDRSKASSKTMLPSNKSILSCP